MRPEPTREAGPRSRPLPLASDAPEASAILLVQADDEPVVLSDTPLEGWLALGLFWLLAITVALQFVTRYGLNDSAAWTEEIARYILIACVFFGASLGVIKNDHIQVSFLYRYLSRRTGRVLSSLVDLLRVAFFGCLVVLMAILFRTIGGDEMTVVPLPMGGVYAVIELALCAMTWRSVRVAIDHYRLGSSALEQAGKG
jgi:TRAP-type transport system small permease protein